MKKFILLKKVSPSLVFLSLSPIVIITACKSEVDKKPTTSKNEEAKNDTSKNEISKNDPKNETKK
ncbi:hypothetical protein, partial [Mesomycoplasma ovipneumoniae]